MSHPTAIRFVLDGAVREITTAPTRTVLHLLREGLGRNGTKEGCAEGDCGACTVVLGELDQGSLRYRAVNACIQFVPTLDGKALFTVESLGRSGALHPVQQALADGHGSQCGFCTPGFVMSLFALYKTDAAPDRAAINDALAGNLCRCTGYRPIVAAATAMYALGRAQPDHAVDAMNAPAGVACDNAALLEQLRTIRRREGVSFRHENGAFHAPRTLAELAALCEQLPHARLLAGGTDIGLWVTKQQRDLGEIIYIGNVAELRRIDLSSSHVEIGAAVVLTDVQAVLVQHYPALQELLRRFASPPIRNAGTLAGNVANGSPIGDTMPSLIALGATVVLRKGAAARELALEDFYLAYGKTVLASGEFIQRVRVPLPTATQMFRSYKISKRFDQDISAVCGAFALELGEGRIVGARIAYGGMAATPRRALECERVLAGRLWDQSAVEAGMAALARDFAPISDMRATSRYRMRVAQNLLRRLHLETAAELPSFATTVWALP